MKALYFVPLLLGVIFGCVPQNQKNLIGTWELEDINGTPPGIPPTITFNSDHSMKMSYMGEAKPGIYTLIGDSLTLDMDEVVQYHRVLALVGDSLSLGHGESYHKLVMSFRRLPK